MKELIIIEMNVSKCRIVVDESIHPCLCELLAMAFIYSLFPFYELFCLQTALDKLSTINTCTAATSALICLYFSFHVPLHVLSGPAEYTVSISHCTAYKVKYLKLMLIL